MIKENFMINLKDLTIKKAHEAMMAGEYTAVDLASAYLENIKNKNNTIRILKFKSKNLVELLTKIINKKLIKKKKLAEILIPSNRSDATITHKIQKQVK